MGHLKDGVEKSIKDNVMVAINAVRNGYIRTNSEFVVFLGEAGVNSKDIHKALEEILKEGEEKDIIDAAKYLGEKDKDSAKYLEKKEKEKGISLLKRDWLSNNFDKFSLKDKIPSNYWGLFKDKKWVNKNKPKEI